MSNPIKPDHYAWHPSGIRCHVISGEFPHHLGSAIEYIWRCHHKGSLEDDLEKAKRHIDLEIERVRAAKAKATPPQPASVETAPAQPPT